VDVAGEPLDEAPVTEVFRVQVAPEGAVRYVDDAGVDEVGYLAYTATGQWETGDAPPWTAVPSPPDGADLCTRNPAVQAALLGTLGAGRDCASVTWAELAALPSLHVEVGPGHPVLMKRDLAGLSMLTQLTLSAPSFQRFWWGRDLLADLPRLRTLEIDLYSPKLPEALLAVRASPGAGAGPLAEGAGPDGTRLVDESRLVAAPSYPGRVEPLGFRPADPGSPLGAVDVRGPVPDRGQLGFSESDTAVAPPDP